MKFFKYIPICVSFFIAGCETLMPPSPGDNPNYAPSYPIERDPKLGRLATGTIYNSETSRPLFETQRARHVGDVLTVVLKERTTATKQAATKQTKNDAVDIKNAAFLGQPISLGHGYNMDFDLKNKRNFDGNGESRQNNLLEGSITVTVAGVLTNGNMMIQGEKWIKINQGNEYVRLSGVVRPEDIRPDNSIDSDRVANARISYGGTGQVNNSNAQGWLSRILWAPFFPT
jgi:flagellar L-ring protein precursor FlgH